MNRRRIALAAGATIVVLAIAYVAAFEPAMLDRFDPTAPRWVAVASEVGVGDGVRIAVRVLDAARRPIANATITQVRLDMGPDGMATMTAPLRPLSAQAAGEFAFDTDLAMEGRWALTVMARIEGHWRPSHGVVVFTAKETKEKIAPTAAAKSPRILYYRNPMGLPDVSPAPKKDSMGMAYIPVYENEIPGPPGTVRIEREKVQRTGVRTEIAGRHVLRRTLRGVGTLAADESRIMVVSAKFAGFIEELLVPVTGAIVRPGEPLLRVWIESPEILQKQADYLAALRGASTGRPGDIERSERNLRLFDFPGEAIQRLQRHAEPLRSVVLAARGGGTVMQKPAVAGMRFEVGDPLYKITDLSVLWAMIEIPERELGFIRVGQAARVTLHATPAEPRAGRVTFIYPELSLATRTVTLRLEIANPDGRLKPGQFAEVEIDADLATTPVLALPLAAIIDSGSRQVAFVAKEGGLFEPRALRLGRRGSTHTEILEGIAEGERVVVSGNFLIDSESNLRSALDAFAPPRSAP